MDKFWSKVDKAGDCWNWTASVWRNGYGRFWSSADQRVVRAHRYSYKLAYGPIPEGLVIDHRCGNRRCVNPSHLSAVTDKINKENRLQANRNSASRVRGVSPVRGGRYRVQVGHLGANHYGGTFKTLAEAEAAAIALRNRLHSNNLADRTQAA